MTEAPSFLRRKPKPDLEEGVRDILSRLRDNSDRETSEVLASATNTYLSALIRFRGKSVLNSVDIHALFTIWQILLDIKRDAPQDFAAGLDRVEPLLPDEEEK